MQTGRDFLSGRLRSRLGRAGLAVLFLLVFCFALCIRTGARELMSPAQAFSNLWLWARLEIAERFDLPLKLQRAALIQTSPYFFETVSRFRNLIVTMLCGAAIAVGGACYQVLFRNPMAAPTMLGVGSGINLGLLILVAQYSVEAYAMMGRRFAYCLGLAFAMLILVMAAGRFAGKNRRSVTDMLLVGSVLGQVSGAVVTFVRFRMEQEDLTVFQTLSMYGLTVNTDYEFAGKALMLLIALFLGCMIPLFAMRFSFDAMSYPDEDAKLMGIDPGLVRIVCLILVTAMVTSSILFCGTIGTLSLAVPHISRYLYGSRFRSVLGGSCFLGALLLMICRAISSLIYLPGMGFFPIGTLAGLVCAPVLAMVLAQRRRGWE